MLPKIKPEGSKMEQLTTEPMVKIKDLIAAVENTKYTGDPLEAEVVIQLGNVGEVYYVADVKGIHRDSKTDVVRLRFTRRARPDDLYLYEEKEK